VLSWYGRVSGLSYDFTTPGGCNSLQCTLAVPPGWRDRAISTGRVCEAIRGGTIIWAGVLDEPSLTSDGWQVTARGAALFGDDYLAIYSTAWGTGVFNDAVDQAIARGLFWNRITDIGAVANIWTGQQSDSGAMSVTDLLNLGCHKGGLTWQLRTGAFGNNLTVFAVPTTANRILVAGDPVGRAVGDGPTTLYARYQATADNAATNAPATYALTSVSQAGVEAAIGRREDLMDISSAGVYTAGQAQAVATRALARYSRVGFAEPFNVQPGELLNTGGQPVDLGTFWADGITSMVCELWLADYPYGGEVAGGPVTFLVGSYAYNPDGTATITPFQSQRRDWSAVMGVAVDTAPDRTKPAARVTTHPMI
jgi:hypothetical protein